MMKGNLLYAKFTDLNANPRTHVHLWWIHVNVWQNQYSIIKQNKVKIKKNFKERYLLLGRTNVEAEYFGQLM